MKNQTSSINKSKKTKKKLSVIIIAKDEEEKIGDCLKSVKFADEIILVDTGSKDKTVDIAKKRGAKIVKYTKGSYSDWRNRGLEEAGGEWVLYVDADERVTPSLRDEVIQLINKAINQYSAYAIPRKNIILGREMKYGGWWPDYVKRLYKKKSLKKWVGDLHEEPVISSKGRSASGGEGKMGHLGNPLIHIKHDNLSEMIEKTNKWSEVEARLMYKANHPRMNIPRFFSAMFREFWLRMIRHKAFLDGGEGIIYAFYQVYSRFISYAKLWELQLVTQSSNVKSQS